MGEQMEVRLHANATTTPKTRKYIQTSPKSVSELAKELNVNESTIRRWKSRQTVSDGSHTRHNLNQSTRMEEEEIIVELKQRAGLSLDDITEVIHRCVNPKISRSAIYRCLKRRGAMKRPQESGEIAPLRQSFEATEFGYVHVDLKHLTKLEKQHAYVFVAIERTTRFVHVEIVYRRDAETIAACLERFLAAFPYKVHTILTDNGSEFTDRFAVCKIDKPIDKPSGKHPFDRVCKEFSIKHKLTRPFTPQTNGMVERFNRRISEAIASKAYITKNQGKNKFHSHQERNEFIANFVANYNKTRLCCLNYKSPLEIIANHAELYTEAGDDRGVAP
jgi:IS30 family transposase